MIRQSLLRLCLILCLLAFARPAQAQTATFYVATNGSDSAGNGSSNAPWATISHAIESVPDGSLILVRPGTYHGQVRLRGNFPNWVTIRSEVPYRALLRHSDQTVVASGSASGIIFDGFDIAHKPGAGPLVVHVSGSRKLGQVHDIILRNNIMHDSYSSDILKIDASATDIIVENNIFFNQSGSDEHIDVNSAKNIIIRNNIFFNDFEGSGRRNTGESSNFIVIKDSSGTNDELLGSFDITVSGNIFFNWQGLSASAFIMVGEDGKPYFEAQGVTIENNLMLGNSPHEMRAPLGVYGSKNVVFRNNTVSGDLPTWAYAMVLSKADSNPSNENIQFFNNVWADQTGTMGAQAGKTNNDFSDSKPDRTASFALDHNIYWNGGRPIPLDPSEKVNYTNDAHPFFGDPGLPQPGGIQALRYDEARQTLSDGSTSIRQAFERLVNTYGKLPPTSAAVGAADPSRAPAVDILGKPRGKKVDAGAYQTSPTVEVVSFAGDGYVQLKWQYYGTLPNGATWNIVRGGITGDSPRVIATLPADARSYRVDGLQNYVSYIFTVSAVGPDGKNLVSSEVRAIATDIFVFAPLVGRSR